MGIANQAPSRIRRDHKHGVTISAPLSTGHCSIPRILVPWRASNDGQTLSSIFPLAIIQALVAALVVVGWMIFAVAS